MRQLKSYETCEIEIISLADVITSSGGFNGNIDEFFAPTAPATSWEEYEQW